METGLPNLYLTRYWPFCLLTFLWFLSLNLASGVSSDDFEFVPTAQKMTAVRAKVKGESRLKSGKLPRILHQGQHNFKNHFLWVKKVKSFTQTQKTKQNYQRDFLRQRQSLFGFDVKIGGWQGNIGGLLSSWGSLCHITFSEEQKALKKKKESDG